MGLFDLFGKKKEKSAAEKSAALREQAMANVRAAREQIGDETLRKIADILEEQSAGKAARDKIRTMDAAHVAGHVKTMLDE